MCTFITYIPCASGNPNAFRKLVLGALASQRTCPRVASIACIILQVDSRERPASGVAWRWRRVQPPCARCSFVVVTGAARGRALQLRCCLALACAAAVRAASKAAAAPAAAAAASAFTGAAARMGGVLRTLRRVNSHTEDTRRATLDTRQPKSEWLGPCGSMAYFKNAQVGRGPGWRRQPRQRGWLQRRRRRRERHQQERLGQNRQPRPRDGACCCGSGDAWQRRRRGECRGVLEQHLRASARAAEQWRAEPPC